jgi:hypothetical protein
MNKFVKPIALMGLAGALAIGAMAPQAEARNGRWAAGAAGFAAGALIGGAVASANANNYYGGYYEPGYAYAPGYAYDSYAYEPGYAGYADDTYAYAPAYQGNQTYYSSYRNNHSYGWRTGRVNRPNDSYTMNKRHLEGTE